MPPSEVIENSGPAEVIEVAVAEVVTERVHLVEVFDQIRSELVLEVQAQCEIVETQPAVEVIEVLIPGPPGPIGSAPKSPSFTWAAGKLASVLYADGSTKTLTYTSDRLTQVDFARVGHPATRKTLTYNVDGTLAAVVEVNL